MTRREVTIRTADHGPVTVVCPPWCQGHEGQDDEFRADIGHEGPEHTMTLPTSRGPATVLTAGLEQRPYTEYAPGRAVFVNVEIGADWYPADADGLEAMATALTDHAATLRSLAAQLRGVSGATP
ncbi:DUF6907 domain-containing protein [Streptomyces hokutonensis]|uniref:DUF6907 domain-containing protein n=1 Tax=Streptomyces hokutonensis TaxID=1306990 RepID=UPI0003630515|nr:hypothetical protein [Streptomyces hokutonensis]